jgi:exonuclease SbcC
VIRLRELSIQAFRGVPDRITVDLSAPLTMIYAPNGSGKTTICEAAEWLLTGGVKRLESSGSSDDDLRCRFSPASTPTLVSATLDVEGEALALERMLSGCRWRLGDNRWQRVSQATLL